MRSPPPRSLALIGCIENKEDMRIEKRDEERKIVRNEIVRNAGRRSVVGETLGEVGEIENTMI